MSSFAVSEIRNHPGNSKTLPGITKTFSKASTNTRMAKTISIMAFLSIATDATEG